MQYPERFLARLFGAAMVCVVGPVWADKVIDPLTATFSDNYIGAAAYDNDPSALSDDVIGNAWQFDIHSLSATLSGTLLTVEIHTEFAGHEGSYSGATTDLLDGIGHGDLFLSNAWSPVGDLPYPGDNAEKDTSTVWTYGVTVDNRLAPRTGDLYEGNATLYALGSGDNELDIIMSDAFIDVTGFRHGQAVAVNTGSGGVSAITEGVAPTWSVNDAANLVTFNIDLAGTNLLDGDHIAFHWAMTCANDVIEGQVDLIDTGGAPTVPIPAAAWLFGSALAGFIGLARRRKSAAS